jgi:hypothetical protein
MDNECMCQKNTTKTCHACGQSSLIFDYDDESEEESEETTNEADSLEDESSDERPQSDEGRTSGPTSGFWYSLKQIFDLLD